MCTQVSYLVLFPQNLRIRVKYYFCRSKNNKMRYHIVILSVITSLVFLGCGSGKQLAQNREMAETYYKVQNYSGALLEYEKVINVYETNNNTNDCQAYTSAGISAIKTGNTALAIVYLKKATNTRFANQNTYYYLSLAYNMIDNLSLEITTSNDYLNLFPDGDSIADVNYRLFFAYSESDNYDKALELWPDIIAGSSDNIELLEEYFMINRGLNNVDVCNEVAKNILSIDDNNIVAITWFGKQYYRKAEDKYQKEMKAYDKNKTNKQYRRLLKVLDEVTIDFKKSLTYFNQLYKLQPNSENANYLSHIYNRLSDKKKSDYYKKLTRNAQKE
jgi:tetratricopeptide (TPR) repeat protein